MVCNNVALVLTFKGYILEYCLKILLFSKSYLCATSPAVRIIDIIENDSTNSNLTQKCLSMTLSLVCVFAVKLIQN